MAIPPNALFARVRHLGNTRGSIYLNDLDTYLNKYPELKVPVYVPFEGSIDIPLVDEVLISYNRGSLYKHAQNNLIEVLIFSEKSVTTVTNTNEYQIGLESEIILVDTSLGDVTVTLPATKFLPEGREIFIKKSTGDTNQLIIESGNGLIDGNLSEVSTSNTFGGFEFRTAEGGWWLGGQTGGTGGTGEDGLSAYEIAVQEGFVGTVEEWLDSLQGEDGAQGPEGPPGADCKSAYQVALDSGFVGTEEEWLDSLQGEDGFIGEDGKSAYEIAVQEGFVGTEAEWLDSLQGADGDVGPQGPEGPAGADGLSLNWQGPWGVETSYLVNDVVSYQGSSYIAVVDTLGTVPGESADWDLVAAKGEDGSGNGTGVDPKVYPHLAKRDSTNSSLVYVGTAEEDGSNESDLVWQIYRQNIENTNEPPQYAESTEAFIHRWTDRESLNYG